MKISVKMSKGLIKIFTARPRKILFDNVFGTQRNITVFGREILNIRRTERRTELCIFGKRIARFSLPKSLLMNAARNDALDAVNRLEIERFEREHPDRTQLPRILFVVDTLETVGGVETRTEKLFDFLRRNGFEPIILAEKNFYTPLKDFINLRLITEAVNVDAKLFDIVRLVKPVTVEFQFKEPKLFHSIDIERLKKLSRVGCTIHGVVNLDLSKVARLDYYIKVAKSLYTEPELPHAILVKNWILRYPKVTFNPQARKALFVSRIDKEKLPTLKSFLRICQKHNIAFEITADRQAIPSRLMDALSEVPDETFIGTVHATKFLQEHGSEYLFVGGVGQAAMEAAAMNMPTLVCSHKIDEESSTFLTKESILFLSEWNFVIRKCPNNPCLGNEAEFFKIMESNPANVQAFAQFQNAELIQEICGEEKVLTRYTRMLSEMTPRQ